MPKRKLENIELRSEEVQEILTKVPNWMIRWGSLLFFSLIVMLLFISWFVKYPDIIVSNATVTTKIPPQKIIARTSGKFDSIFIKNDQKINPHQTLAVIENPANYEDVNILKSILDPVGLRNDKFQFPIDEVPLLLLGDIESDYATFENSYIEYKINRDLKPFSTEVVANKVSLQELNIRLSNSIAQKKINSSEIEIIKQDLDRYKLLFDKGVISAQEYEKKQLEYLNAKRSYKNLSASISQLKEAIAGVKNSSRETDISSARNGMTLLKRVLQNFNKLKTSIRNWELDYVLSSNIKGKVSFLTYWSKNQSVNEGDLIFTIIPSKNSDFIAKLLAPPQNSGKIEIGQRVNINLTNYPETEFGFLEGKVKNISSLPNKEGMYIIDVALPNNLITSYGKEINFKHEMTGSANIITEDLRLIERLFYELKDIFSRES